MRNTITRNFLLVSTFLFTAAISYGQFSVSNGNDSGPGSLRQAVLDSEADPGPNSIVFIGNFKVNLSSGFLDVTQPLTITGNGAGNTIIDAGGTSRIIRFTELDNASVIGITFQNGFQSPNGGAINIRRVNDFQILNCQFLNNTSKGYFGGGAVLSRLTNLTVTGSDFSNNSAINDPAASGGAIIQDKGGNLTVINSTFSNNTSIRAGGAIESNSPDDITLTGVTFFSNTTTGPPGNGGAMHITGAANSMISGSFVTKNTAANEGGGLWNGAGQMTITSTVISDNSANGDDAGASGGGGIYNEGGTIITDENTTITRNLATTGITGSGGGVLVAGGTFTATGTKISSNQSNRAGGGIEVRNRTSDSSPAIISLTNTSLDANITGVNTGTGAPGNGGGLHVSGASNVTVSNGTVALNDASSEGGGLWNGTGTMNVSGAIIKKNMAHGIDADNGGGGIFNNDGTLTVEGADIRNNLADGTAGSGGGIFSTSGIVTISNTSIRNNSANRAGGGVEVIDGTVDFVNVQLSNNDVNGVAGTPAPGNGGGLHVTGLSTAVTFTGSTINRNEASREGGGLWNQAGSTLTIDTSTIDRNSAFANATNTTGGGGIFNNGGILEVTASTISNNNLINGAPTLNPDGIGIAGGGIFNNTNGVATVFRSTISNNNGLILGGGIYNAGNSMAVSASTITQNTADFGGGIYGDSDVSLNSTIVANNTANFQGMDLDGSISSNDYNLIGVDDQNVFTPMANDIEGADPLLGNLKNNGGPTKTHSLDSGSPAINAGDPSILENDQRGFGIVGVRDIGSYENQGPAPVAAPIVLGGENGFNDFGFKVALYPNPSRGFATLQIPESFGNDIQVTVIELGSGKVVRNYKMSNGTTDMDLNNLSDGMYVVQIVSEKETATKRLILAR